ncbi:uncharacterized protein LOC144761753 [Lissotriton helveticus]
MAELHKQANLTGRGRNRAPAMTELEELVESTIEPDSVCGIGDADSSARAATRKGETCRKRPKDKEGSAPRREDTQKASTSAGQTTQETAASTAQPASQDLPASPQRQASPERFGSPLLLSSPELVASPAATTPAVQKTQRHVVATLREMESSAGDTVGGDTSTMAVEGSNSNQQPTAEGAHTGARRRRARDSNEYQHGEGPGVFCGLKASMVKVQRRQGKAIQLMQRQMRHLNENMKNIYKCISSMAEGSREMAAGMREMAASMQDMFQSVLLLCSKLDEDRATRRKERQRSEQHARAVNCLATATSLLCRR